MTAAGRPALPAQTPPCHLDRGSKKGATRAVPGAPSRPNPPHPHNRSFRFVWLAQIDRALDGPEVVALGIEESVGDVPGAVTRLLNLGPVVTAGFGGEGDL